MIRKFPAIFLLALVLSCTALLPDHVAADTRLLTINDLMAMKSVSEPRLSPDGNWVAYTVESTYAEDDESRTAIYMHSTRDDAVVQMTSLDESAYGPRWSPDGRYLTFLSARGEEEDAAKTQVWTLDLRGGEAQQYTDVSQGVSDYRWSPDGARMLLMIKDQSAEERAKLKAEEAGEEPQPVPWVIDRLQFKEDGTTYLDRSRTHLYTVSEPMGETRQLTGGDFDDAEPAFSPDGKHIAFVSNRTEEPDANQNTDIWVVAVDGGTGIPEPRRITTNPGSDYSPAWSNDGAYLAYVTSVEPDLIWYATNHLAIVPVNGGAPRILTDTLDRNVASPGFSPDDSRIFFLLEDSAERHLAAYERDDGAIDRPVHGGLSAGSYDLHPSGDIAILISTPHLPQEVFLLRDDDLTQLTATNAEVLDGLELGEVRNVTFPSEDGTDIEGFITTPPGYSSNRRYPTLLRIHGGPVSQYDFSFSAEAQLFAAHGYVVVMANPRGSSGYGQDFSAALFGEWGVKDFEDVMAGVDYAIEEGYADPDRLGVGGWSYGGILTNYVITKSDRFEGAITGASEVLYTSNYGHDHYQYHWEKELGLPWENQEAWDAISPYYSVGNVTTPTLVMGGKEDWNVPINNSEQLYQALKRRGIDTQLVVYPGESHGISRPSFIRDRYERYLDWYNSRVRGQ